MAIGAGLVALLIILPIAFSAIMERHASHARIEALRQENGRLQAGVSDLETQRDEALAQAAPFHQMAAAQFPSATAKTRLDLLRERISAIVDSGAEARGRRHLDADAAARVRTKLENAPGLEIEIGGVWQDPESLAFAEELRALFNSAGLKTRPVAEYVPGASGPVGLAVYSRHELDRVLGEAIAQLFAELATKPVEWVNEDFAVTQDASSSAPDLKIVVGRR